MEYVRNTWYPLTWSSDIGRSLTRRRIVGEDIVLYRTEQGRVAALHDACPHRLAALSKGRLKGDAIECGYHGMTFDGSGTVHPHPRPGDDPPQGPRAGRSRRRSGWGWSGSGWATRTRPTLLPSTICPSMDDPDWSVAYGDALEIEANYLNLADNLCDPAHVSFVHLSTLGSPAGEDIPVQRRATEDGRAGMAVDQEQPGDPNLREIRQLHRPGRSLALLSLHRAEYRRDRLRQRRGRPDRG